MRNENLNLSTKSEIADLRMRLAHQALEGGEKLRIYEKIYEKSLTLGDGYPQKNEEVKKIVYLAINQGEYEKVHQYCKKTYEDVDLDPRTKADLLYQESLAFVAESKLHKAFDHCFESYKIKRDPKTLSELQIILTKSLEELPVVSRTNVEMATTSLNQEDPNFVEMNLLYKEINALKDFEPNFSMRSFETNSLLPNSRSRIEPTAELAPRVTGAGVFLERGGVARRIAPTDLPTPRVTANLGFSQPEAQVARQNIQGIPRRNIREAQQAQDIQQAQEIQEAQEIQQVQEIQQAQDIQEELLADLLNHQFSMMPEQPVLTKGQLLLDLIESLSSIQQQTAKKDPQSEFENTQKGIEDIIRKFEELNKRTDISEEERIKQKIKMESELESLRNNHGNFEKRLVRAEGGIENHEKRLTQNEKDLAKVREDLAKAKEDLIKINRRLDRYDKMFGNVVRFKSMDELMKEFEDHLAKRRQQEASLPSEDDSSIEIVDPIAQRNADKDKFYQDQLKAIELNFVLRNYFETMVADLNSFFIASKALQSKTLEPKNPKFVALNYLKILVNLVPTLGTIGECVAECLESTYKKQKKIIAKENIARFASLAETTSDFEQIAKRLAIDYLVSSEVESRALQIRNRLDGQDNRQEITKILISDRGDQELLDFFDQEHNFDESQALLAEFEQIGESQEAQKNTRQFVISCFNSGKARVVDNVNGVGSILGKKDALKLIELMQKKELIDEVARRREQPVPVDIRRRASIVADTIIEKLRQNNAQRGDENPLSSIAVLRARNVNFALEITDEQLGILTAGDNPQQSNQEAPSSRMSGIYCLAILQKFIGKRK